LQCDAACTESFNTHDDGNPVGRRQPAVVEGGRLTFGFSLRTLVRRSVVYHHNRRRVGPSRCSSKKVAPRSGTGTGLPRAANVRKDAAVTPRCVPRRPWHGSSATGRGAQEAQASGRWSMAPAAWKPGARPHSLTRRGAREFFARRPSAPSGRAADGDLHRSRRRRGAKAGSNRLERGEAADHEDRADEQRAAGRGANGE